MSRLFCTPLLLLALGSPLAWSAETAAEVTDLVEPRGEPGLVQRLELITVATLSLAETERFYRQGYGLELEGPIELAPQAMADQRRLWGVAEDFGWVEYRLSRPATWGMPRVRLLGLTAPAEPGRTDWSATAPGAQGIGFAAQDAAALAARLQTLGFGGVPLRETDSRRSDDSAVAEREAVHHGPDFVRAIARERIAASPHRRMRRWTRPRASAARPGCRSAPPTSRPVWPSGPRRWIWKSAATGSFRMRVDSCGSTPAARGPARSSCGSFRRPTAGPSRGTARVDWLAASSGPAS